MFQTPSTINSLRTLADSTVRLQIDCQELPPDQMTELFKLRQKLGWFLFKENEIEQSDIPDEPSPEFKGDKTPSQRLRNTLYVYWEQNTNKKKTFDTFYKEWIDKKIETIKENLNDTP
tara:strand:- start:514 stop:867 length:354 start_codon:yes stop_codon:yes gene_type:complete